MKKTSLFSIFIWFVSAVFVFWLLAIFLFLKPTEERIKSAVVDRLQKKGYENLGVIVRGQQVILEGVFPTEKEAQSVKGEILGGILVKGFPWGAEKNSISKIVSRYEIQPEEKIDERPVGIAFLGLDSKFAYLSGEVSSTTVSEELTENVQKTYPNHTLVNTLNISDAKRSQTDALVQTTMSTIPNSDSFPYFSYANIGENWQPIESPDLLVNDAWLPSKPSQAYTEKTVEAIRGEQQRIEREQNLPLPNIVLWQLNATLTTYGTHSDSTVKRKFASSVEEKWEGTQLVDVSVVSEEVRKETFLAHSPVAEQSLALLPSKESAPAETVASIHTYEYGNDQPKWLSCYFSSQQLETLKVDELVPFTNGFRRNKSSMHPLLAQIKAAIPAPKPNSVTLRTIMPPSSKGSPVVEPIETPQPKKEAEKTVKLDEYVIEPIYFGINVDDTSKQYARALSDVREYLNAEPKAHFSIVGHTCDIGEEKGNMRLSKRRAEKFKSFLVKNGISSGTVSADGKGELSPRKPNTNKANRRENRRVEILPIH